MALTLGPGATGDKLAAKQDVGTDVIVEINGDLRTISGSTDAYGSLFQGALSTTATALIGPASGTDMIVDSITVTNPGASTRIVTFYKTKNSVTYDATTQWGPPLRLLTGQSAMWSEGTWRIFTSSGIPVLNPAVGYLQNFSVASQTPFATDTYLTGSAIAIPAGMLAIGASYRCKFDVAKTAAGTATPIVVVRFGVNGTTADTARLTFTFTAGTAAIDVGTFEIEVTFRVVGASGVMQGRAQIRHNLSITGLVNLVSPTLQVTSAAFDTGVANSIIGVSVNGGTAAAWTVQQVRSELISAVL